MSVQELLRLNGGISNVGSLVDTMPLARGASKATTA